MFKPGQLKYPFGVRTLEERLELEKKWLISFRKVGDKPWSKEYSEVNTKSCEHRIVELELSIKAMKSMTYTKEECDELNKNVKE